MHKVTSSLVALDEAVSDEDARVIATHREVMTKIDALAGAMLLPVMRALGVAPTAASCVRLSTLLVVFGADLLTELRELLVKEPRGGESALAVGSHIASHFGSPIVGRLTNLLDLRPQVGQVPPAGAGEVSPQPPATWREEAKAALDGIAVELARRDFDFGPLPPSASGLMLPNSPIIGRFGSIFVEVGVSPFEHEPFTLRITRSGSAAPLIAVHSTAHAQLVRTVSAFVAGYTARRDEAPAPEDRVWTLADIRDQLAERGLTATMRDAFTLEITAPAIPDLRVTVRLSPDQALPSWSVVRRSWTTPATMGPTSWATLGTEIAHLFEGFRMALVLQSVLEGREIAP
jgi:hypothetical protein